MPKVIILDDKPIIRQSIISTVPWESLDCEVVGEGEDGLEGKKLMDLLRPDIVITDIKMPEVDGLALTEYITDQYPETQVIIITGYEDFSYAQRAVKLGVCGLVLKPISRDDLCQSILKAIKHIESVHQQKFQNQKIMNEKKVLEESFNQKLPLIQSGTIVNLIHGFNEENLGTGEKSAFQDVKMCCLAVLRPDSLDSGNVLVDVLKVVQEELRLVFAADIRGKYITTVINNYIVIVFLFSSIIPERDIKCKILSECRTLFQRVQKCLGINCSIGVSRVIMKMDDLSKSYKEALKALEFHFYEDGTNVIHIDEVGDHMLYTEQLPFQELYTFFDHMEKSGNIESELDKLFFTVKANSYSEINMIKAMFWEICVWADKYYYEKTGRQYFSKQTMKEVYVDIERASNIEQLYKLTRKIVTNIWSEISVNRYGEYSLTVQRAIRFMEANYSRDFSLYDTAENIGVNPSYLSRLIKKEVGMGFSDFIAKIRIDYAKKLLEKENVRIHEVGELVGYRDYNYFYKVFKKLVGISPTEYKSFFNMTGGE